jgi:hypothetical protein
LLRASATWSRVTNWLASSGSTRWRKSSAYWASASRAASSAAAGVHRLLVTADLEAGEPELGLRLIEDRLVGARVDDEEQVAGADPLVVDDRQRDDRPGDVRGDADGVGAHVGVVGARLVVEHAIDDHAHHSRGDDDGGAEQASGEAQQGVARRGHRSDAEEQQPDAHAQQQRQARIDQRQRAQVRLEADAGEEQAQHDGGDEAEQQAQHPGWEEGPSMSNSGS